MSRLREVQSLKTPVRPASNRAHIRAQIVPSEIRGILTLTATSDHMPFLVWDVSPTGLGLWTTGPLAVGETVKIVVGQPYLLILNATVMWCDHEPSAQGFRCGVQVAGKQESLTSLYEKFGG